MNELFLALQFLTAIPIKFKSITENKLANSLIYFPLVGLILGLILSGINSLFLFLGFQDLSINVILIISLVVLTAGMHLDGLADTFDAFLSNKNKEEMLKIMRDPHIGVMGVVSIVCVILLKIALLSNISPYLKVPSLLLMCVLSRWVFVLVIYLFPYARQEGKAKVFMQGINFKIFIITLAITLCLAVLIGHIPGVIAFLIAAGSSYLLAKYISKKISGITGDALGAINELTEIIILFSICILGRSNLWIS